MADIVDQLRLDIDEALRDVNRIEDALDRALSAIEVKIDPASAVRQLDDLARQADQAFDDVDIDIDSTGAQRLNSELATAKRHLGDADEEAARLERNLEDAARAFNGVDTTARGTTSSFSTLEKSAGNIRNALVALGGAAIFAGAIRGANAAIQSFAVLEDSINAVNVIFDSAGDSVLKFGEDAARSAGLSEAAFNQAVTPIGALLQNFGFDAREAGDAAVILVQRAADLASVLGGDVTTALEAISSALRGQSEPLTAYGATISAARVEQFALANGLAATKAEITDAITLQARYGLILEDTSAVAGDYAATAGDLANAQRTAAAEAANFGTDIGEVLAPALEVIVGLIPDVLEGLRQLVPGFAAAGDSAAAFLEDAAIGGDDSGFLREFFSTIRAGAGDIGELIPGLGDLATVIGASVVTNVDAADRALARLDQRLARSQLRTIGTQLAKSLDDGNDATEAFTLALGKLGAESDVIEVFEQGYRDFAIQANLTDVELQNSTRDLLLNAEALHLGADEIDFLRRVLNELNEELDDGGRANADYLASIAAIEGSGALGAAATLFTTFTDQIGEIPDRMRTSAEAIRTAAAEVGEALNPFDDAAAEIDVSAREFFDNLTRQINEEAVFQAGIVELILREQFDLAAKLAPAGPAAQATLDEFLANIDIAEAANRALGGQGTELSEEIGFTLIKAIEDADTPEVEAALVELMSFFTNTQVRNAVQRGTADAAQTGVSAFRRELEREIAQFNVTALANEVETLIGGALDFSDFAAAQGETGGEAAVEGFIDGITGTDIASRVQAVFDRLNIVADFFDDGAESRATYFDGLSTPQAGEVSRLRDSIVGRLDSAIQRDSPPKLFLDAGIESGEAFWSGFNQADLTLRTALPAITGGIASGTTVGGVGGVHVELHSHNPVQVDQVSDHARMAQIAGSVAQTYNQVHN